MIRIKKWVSALTQALTHTGKCSEMVFISRRSSLGRAQPFVGLVVISFWSMAKSMAEEITWLILRTVLALNPVG